MTKQYELIMHVTEDRAAGALALGTLVSMHEIDAAGKITKPGKRAKLAAASSRKHYVGGKRDKGISGEALLRSIIEDGQKHSLKDMQKSFAAKGFSPKTVSPIVTRLIKAGEVIRPDKASYQLKPGTAAAKN